MESGDEIDATSNLDEGQDDETLASPHRFYLLQNTVRVSEKIRNEALKGVPVFNRQTLNSTMPQKVNVTQIREWLDVLGQFVTTLEEEFSY